MFDVPPDHQTPDGVGRVGAGEATPTIVSLSDVHGYLDQARSALTAVGGTAEYPPVVTADEDGTLHWAGNDYLLVVNGDLVDRGPANEECVALVERLTQEAPPGRVRYHLGNHEMAVLFQGLFGWDIYSIELDDDARREFTRAVADGAVPVAFEGYEYTYSHAGANTPIDVAAVNDAAREAAQTLLARPDAWRSDRQQLDIAEEYDRVFGLGGPLGRGADAGLLWMDFQHVTEGAPPQIIGHSRQSTPTRKGEVVCENVIRENRHTEGGEAVVLEEPDGATAIVREPNGVSVNPV
jgi:Calcineurin-like phosphoesterase.